MTESFELTLSKPLGLGDLAAALTELLPGLRVDVRHDPSELPDEPGAVWAVVHGTNDPAWPCVLDEWDREQTA